MPPKTKKKGLEPGPDLPGLFPIYDGSYGINTLISATAESKKGHKSNKGTAKEQSDDQKWESALKGKAGKKYGMNSNLKKVINKSHKELEEEEHQGHKKKSPVTHNSINSSQPQNEDQLDPPGPSSSSSSSGHSGSMPGVKPSEHFEPSEAGSDSSDDYAFYPDVTPHVPKYDPNDLPFKEEYEGQHRRPPYARTVLPSDNPNGHITINQPIMPSSEYIPFYGMPTGAGSNGPISPIRPNTSRSFNMETGLFTNAALQTPGPKVDGFGRPLNTAQGPEPSAPKQTTGTWLKGLFGTGNVQPTTQPDPSIQPATKEHSVNQPTPDMKPTVQEKQIPVPPTLGSQSSTGYISPPIEPTSDKLDPVGQPTLSPKASPKVQHTTSELLDPKNTPSNSSVGDSSETDSDETDSDDTDGNESLPPLYPSTPPQEITPPVSVNGTKSPEPKSPPPTKTPPIPQNPPNQPSTWSPDFVLKSLLWFVIFASALWFALPAVPGDLDDIDRAPRTSSNLPSFSIGKMWETITNLLPEIPDIQPIPYDNINNSLGSPSRPGPADDSDVDSDKLATEVKKWIPGSVWVQGKDGKLKIPEDFWHALRELIAKDDSILSLKKGNISEDHWLAIKSRIQDAGSGVGTSLKNMEAIVQKKISQTWDSWLKQNNQALEKASTGTALTRDDFMKLFQEEIANYNDEIKKECTGLQDRIEDITQRMSELRDEISSIDNISMDEITKTVNSLISQAIKNAKLDAVAQGAINGHSNDVLANQVNFFAFGGGATIDPDLTSPTWKMPKDFFKSKKWLDRDGYKTQPPSAALSPWTQEGECFCAGPDRKGFGQGTNNISVLISRNVIPQHLVVEHILPGATLDPGAMPREIELWAYIEEITLRGEVQVFSDKQFPGLRKEEVLNEGYVKIGHFTYENRTTGDGTQVFKISDELSRMRAITDQIVIRAINNYGADHTCFYRLRVYGEVVERPDDPPALQNRDRRFWF